MVTGRGCRLGPPPARRFVLSSLLLLLLTILSIRQMEAQDPDTQLVEEVVGTFSDQLEKDQKYQDIFHLTEDDFDERVLESVDPWIVIFHDGRLSLDWKKMAVELRGIVWVGMVNREEETFVDDMDFPSSMEDEVVFAKIYPYGSERVKTSKAGWNHTNDPQMARDIAMASIPNICPVMRAMGTNFNDFLRSVYQESSEEGEALRQFIHASFFPGAGLPRFPAFFITEIDDEALLPLFRSVALHFQAYFHFGRLLGVSRDFLSGAGLLADMPGILILLPVVKDQRETTVAKVDFYGLSYDLHAMEGMDYPRVLQFLFAVNKEMRHHLPADNGSDNLDVLNMEDLMEVEGQRFDLFVYTDITKVPMKNDRNRISNKDEL